MLITGMCEIAGTWLSLPIHRPSLSGERVTKANYILSRPRRPAKGVGEPSKEIQQPMAVVILGGIFTSTFLNMIVIPALYLKFGRARARAAIREYPREGDLATAE